MSRCRISWSSRKGFKAGVRVWNSLCPTALSGLHVENWKMYKSRAPLDKFSMENPADSKSPSPLEEAFWLKNLLFQLPACCGLSEAQLHPFHPWRIQTFQAGWNSGEGRHLQDAEIPKFLGREILEQIFFFVAAGHSAFGDKHKGAATTSKGLGNPRVWSRICCFPGKLQHG